MTKCTKKELLELYQAAFNYEFKNITEKESDCLKGIFASAIVIIDTLWTDESKKFYADNETGERGLVD